MSFEDDPVDREWAPTKEEWDAMDDEYIRSDKDLADDYRAGMERQDRLIATMQADLDAKQAKIQQLLTWVPHPSEMSGWADPECDSGTASIIREACEIHGVEVPEHLR
jgi:hypothetical protein